MLFGVSYLNILVLLLLVVIIVLSSIQISKESFGSKTGFAAINSALKGGLDGGLIPSKPSPPPFDGGTSAGGRYKNTTGCSGYSTPASKDGDDCGHWCGEDNCHCINQSACSPPQKNMVCEPHSVHAPCDDSQTGPYGSTGSYGNTFGQGTMA